MIETIPPFSTKTRGTHEVKVITWNMQGAKHTTENIWSTKVKALLKEADIVCLQECGSVPDSAKGVPRPVHTDETTEHKAAEITLVRLPGLSIYTWGGSSTRGGDNNIIFLHTDTKGNRVNLAVVSPCALRIGSVSTVLGPASGPHKRPVLLVQFDVGYVGNVHGISPNGADVRGLLGEVAKKVPTPWYVFGDYNRTPDTIAPSPTDPQWVVCPANGNTYSTADPKYIYDYGVFSPGLGAVTGIVRTDVHGSDHFPVQFELP